MQTTCKNVVGIVSDFLDISKIEAGVITLKPAPVHLPGDLHHELAAYCEVARDRAIELDVETDGCEMVATADVQRVRQVLGNLVSNALKFTDAGRVQVRFESRQNVALVSVEDSGIGIAAEHLLTLFEPFKRIEIPGQQTREGTGLGLAIARQIVEAHHGAIRVQSDGRTATTFVVELPALLQPAGVLANA